MPNYMQICSWYTYTSPSRHRRPLAMALSRVLATTIPPVLFKLSSVGLPCCGLFLGPVTTDHPFHRVVVVDEGFGLHTPVFSHIEENNPTVVFTVCRSLKNDFHIDTSMIKA
uniref:Uncharacterized protein n=1 Tax=Leersia perrieri TaxID=77586 RepID=A0A0D9XKL4_9ORYZ